LARDKTGGERGTERETEKERKREREKEKRSHKVDKVENRGGEMLRVPILVGA
jgi:hypothetical protein